MARFQCRACGFDSSVVWKGKLTCPCCGGTAQVWVTVAVEEMEEADLILLETTMRRRAWLTPRSSDRGSRNAVKAIPGRNRSSAADPALRLRHCPGS